jgi:hypothetical protein
MNPNAQENNSKNGFKFRGIKIFQSNPSPVKKQGIGKRSFRVAIAFTALFMTLIISTIILNVIFPAREQKNVSEVQTPATTQTTSGSTNVQTKDLYKSDFDLGSLKIKSSLPTSWKAAMTTIDLGKVQGKKITVFNDINDRIEINFLPFEESAPFTGGTVVKTGGGESFESKDLVSIGSILGKEMYRQKDVQSVLKSQIYQTDYSFKVISTNKENKLSSEIFIKNYNVEIQYFTPAKDFLEYNSDTILSSFDKILKSITLV